MKIPNLKKNDRLAFFGLLPERYRQWKQRHGAKSRKYRVVAVPLPTYQP